MRWSATCASVHAYWAQQHIAWNAACLVSRWRVATATIALTSACSLGISADKYPWELYFTLVGAPALVAALLDANELYGKAAQALSSFKMAKGVFQAILAALSAVLTIGLGGIGVQNVTGAAPTSLLAAVAVVGAFATVLVGLAFALFVVPWLAFFARVPALLLNLLLTVPAQLLLKLDIGPTIRHSLKSRVSSCARAVRSAGSAFVLAFLSLGFTNSPFPQTALRSIGHAKLESIIVNVSYSRTTHCAVPREEGARYAMLPDNRVSIAVPLDDGYQFRTTRCFIDLTR